NACAAWKIIAPPHAAPSCWRYGATIASSRQSYLAKRCCSTSKKRAQKFERSSRSRGEMGADDLAKLIVGKQTALVNAFALHRSQHLRFLFFGQIDAQLAALQFDAIEPALFSQHDAALGTHHAGGVRLDGFRNV